MYEARNLIYSCNQGTPECNLSWSAFHGLLRCLRPHHSRIWPHKIQDASFGYSHITSEKAYEKTILETQLDQNFQQCEGKLALCHNVFVCKLFLSEPLGIEVLENCFFWRFRRGTPIQPPFWFIWGVNCREGTGKESLAFILQGHFSWKLMVFAFVKGLRVNLLWSIWKGQQVDNR